MKKWILICTIMSFSCALKAQLTYTMGYEKAEIDIVDPAFFSTYQLTDMPPICGIYDKESSTFYTCDYHTYRYIDEDFISEKSEACCQKVDFNPRRYYGTLTLKGLIDTVEWDNGVVYFTTDKARLRIEVDNREIDALYKNFYSENHFGKVALILCLKTYDTPNENVLSYNKNTEVKRKPVRTFTRILRW